MSPLFFSFWSLMTQCSIPVRSEQVEYIFNLSTVASTEKVLTAELHLFKLRPQATLSFHRHHFCQVRAPTCGPLHRTRLLLGNDCNRASCCLVSGQHLSENGHQQRQRHARQEAALLSTRSHPLCRLGSVHHHASGE